MRAVISVVAVCMRSGVRSDQIGVGWRKGEAGSAHVPSSDLCGQQHTLKGTQSQEGKAARF